MKAIEKITSPRDLPKVKQAPKIWGNGSMLIPHPKHVLNIMQSVPKSKTITLDDIRNTLAETHDTDITCPMTTGIFVSLAAKAHEEGSIYVPYWRTLRKGGELNSKFPGGVEAHKGNCWAWGSRVPHVHDCYAGTACMVFGRHR